MSPDIPSPTKSAAYRDDERDVLESLKGLSIKGFNDWYLALPSFFPSVLMRYHHSNDGTGPNTPSSTNASLLTPPALRSSQVFLATGDHYPGHTWYPTAPNAPRMKDLDSFTEGTGQGSFNFPLTAGADEGTLYPLIFHPSEPLDVADDDNSPLDDSSPSPTTTATYTNSLALELLQGPEDPEEFVRAWREGVSATNSNEEEHTPCKRRRSHTASSEAEARRVRARSPTVEPSHNPQLGPREIRYTTSPAETEQPD